MLIGDPFWNSWQQPVWLEQVLGHRRAAFQAAREPGDVCFVLAEHEFT